ncbi:subtilisin-like protein [Trichoderma citrinoviride]|uniref:tripeptidyl-peptidase II n=1 Tax=Trichoderma citrinoviride TaxID=58853 RepID=A0A2T4BGT2_9HYPO|nr:subtilisin-like protein [Trichoderma citrinoviride]PTB68534.1 subtilisin-like protein [Trichoderma citrinoviride]
MKACLLFLGITTALATGNPIVKPSPPGSQDGAIQTTTTTQLARISVALQPECRELLEQALRHLSDPSSPRYGRHLGREEAKALLRPRQESTDAVRGWLARAGVPAGHVSTDGQFLHVQTLADKAQMLLGLKYNSTRGSQTIAVSSLPERIGRHVMTVQYAPDPLDQVWTEADWEECKTAITPGCLRRLYHVDNYRAKHESSNLFGIVGFSGQAAQYDELDKFLHDFAPSSANANFSIESVNGGQSPQGVNEPASEANADIQYAVAMGYNVPVRFYAVGGENHDIIPDLDLVDTENQSLEPFLEFTSHLLDLPDDELPKVVSISYGANEQLFPPSYAQQVCDMFGQLGTRGVSIVVASGDQGPGVSCQSNDGSATRPKFMPSFPATCPYVTSVGATRGIGPEVAADFSSGGFSDYFARPAWQDRAVGAYLGVHGEEWKGYYDPRGRGFPDVAAQGVNYRFRAHRNESLISGTSLSAPVFAALIALLNDHRSKNGMPSMGFLNPWIYSIGSHAFTDITESRSTGCTGKSIERLESPKIPNAGWDAVPGWDPVTGWGTPLFDRLLDLSLV